MTQQVENKERTGVSPALIRKVQAQGAKIKKPTSQAERVNDR